MAGGFFAQAHGGAEADARSLGIFEVGAATVGQLVFDFRFLAHENALLFLGELESGVLAQVALFARDLDVAAVRRDADIDQIVIVLFAPLEAGPRDGEDFCGGCGGSGGFFLRGLEKFLQLGARLDGAGQKGALVHFLEDSGAFDLADEFARGFGIGTADRFADELFVVREHLLEFACAFGVFDVLALDNGYGGFERLEIDQVGEVARAFAEEPGKQLGIRAAFRDALAKMGAQRFEVSFFEEETRRFGHDLGVTLLQNVDEQDIGRRTARGRARFQSVADAPCGERGEQACEMRGRMRQEAGQGQCAFRQGRFAALEDFVAHAEKMDGMGRVASLVVGCGFLEQPEHSVQLVR